MRRLTLLALCLALAPAVGCVSEPRVVIDHAEVKGVSLSGIDLGVVLAIRNDNVFDVKLRRVHADVTIARKIKLAPVDMVPDVWIPADDKIKLAVDVKVPLTIVPAILESTLEEGSVPYRIVGDADVTATRTFGIEEDHYPFDQEGTVPRSLFMKLSPGGIQIDIGGSESLVPKDGPKEGPKPEDPKP
ncbi:MAG: hypothetical protein U0414_26975 [Polyangiaceae bacterium]